MSEQYWKDRADALERAAQEVLSNFMNDERCVFCATNETHAPYSADEHETWCPVRSVKAALDRQEPDQPAQDGETD
jgi:galactose-1-phosphate uridylyltransferase